MDRTQPAGPRPRETVRRGISLVTLAAALASAGPLAAQTAAPERATAAAATSVAPVVVPSAKPVQPGAVIGDIKPEIQFSPAQIQSFGVSTVSELLTELAPETESDRGRGGEMPVILLNGRPISGFNEIRDIPTEAILRVDILPEEVSLKYGYSANQRVVNIVLRPFFRAFTGEAQGGGPTEGGQANGQVEADLFHVRGENRINLDLKYQASSALSEDARNLTSLTTGQPFAVAGNVVPAAGAAQIDPALSALVGHPVTIAGIPAAAASRALALSDFAATADTQNTTDVGQYRTLSPATKQISANAVVSRALPYQIAGSLNATLGATSSDSLQGLPSLSLSVPAGDPFSPFGSTVMVDRAVAALGPLRQGVDGWTGHLGLALNRGGLSGWRLSFTSAYDHADSLTTSDVGLNPAPMQGPLDAHSVGFNPFAAPPAALLALQPESKARSLSDNVSARFVASGVILKLPAGGLRTTFRVEDSKNWSMSRSQRLGAMQTVDLSRNTLGSQVNVDFPITSREEHFLSAVGDLSFNVNAALDHVSDIGDLRTFGYGLNWTPITGVALIVSHTRDQAAPSVQQLAGPTVLTPGVRLFDYATGQTVDVTQVGGGNPALQDDHRNVFKIGLTLKPLSSQDLTITANYTQSRIDNAIATFPAASAAIEAAFPDRFQRDADGDLVEVDYRAVNFAREDRKQLRWGFNFTHAIGHQPPPPPQRFGGRFAGRVPGAGGPPGAGPRVRQRPQGAPANGQASGAVAANGPPNAPAGADSGVPAGPPPDGAPGGPPNGPPGAGPPGGPPNGPPDGPGGAGFRGGGGGGGRGGGGGGGFRGGGGRGGGFGGGGPNGADLAGQVQFAVYHTITFDDQILVRQGGPLLDLLNGAAAGSGGGQARHAVEVQAGYTQSGFGARLSGNWKSGTFVRGADAAEDLSFSSLATLNLRLFANLGAMPKVIEHHPWLRGTRLTISVNNLFDVRERVRDATGATPVSYQPAYLDPAGRVVSIDFRKLFF